MPARVPSPDALAEAAALIRDVGLSAERARRYRALATTVAAPMLDRSIEIGSAVRRAGRDLGHGHDSIAAALTELRQLLAGSEAAIAAVRAEPRYRDAAAAFARGDVGRVSRLAAEIFTDVEPGDAFGRVAWEVPVGGERRGEHFASPATCVARIAAVRRDGLRAASAPAGLGGDEIIAPIALTTDLDAGDGPLLVVYDVGSLPAPPCRLAGSTVALVYAARLNAPFGVRIAATVTDEWWTIRPDAYEEWRMTLAPLLAAEGLTLEVA
jgi:hypothetical protein